MDSPLYITSEIGKLKTILLCRPGEELESLMPEYLADLLFDDIPDLKVAQQEHEAFVKALTDRDVEVVFLEDLTTEALSDPEVKSNFVWDMLYNSKQGERYITETLYNYLQSMETSHMVRKLMAGVRKDEIAAIRSGPKQLHEMLLRDPYPFYLDPMPNILFTRDPQAVIGNGLTINKMHFPARRRESLFIKYVIQHHSRFAGRNVPVWYSRDSKFSIEGGDELVLSKDTVAIGVSQRTTPEAIEIVASRLLGEGGFSQVIAVEIPKERRFMHLDTVLTMIDRDKFTIHPSIQDNNGKMNLFVLTRNADNGELHVKHRANLIEVLSETLGIHDPKLLPCGGGDVVASAREQWNDGSNTLAIAPGVVITYRSNRVTNDLLRENGVEVIEVPGSELGKARGGPRCMSCPMVREDI